MGKILVIHGGAGAWRAEKLEKAEIILDKISSEGFEVLKNKGALDAVECVIKRMEEDELFNAGRGLVLNLFGEIEMDAGIMLDEDNLGFVANVKNLLHPIVLARKVMEITDHIFLAGSGAELLGKCLGLTVDDHALRTKERENQWRTAIRALIQHMEVKDSYIKRIKQIYPKLLKIILNNEEILNVVRKRLSDGIYDTVGAVAFDGTSLVAGTSTGGIFMKFPGRIGDTPIIGAGTYARKNVGAASASGVGEQIIRAQLCLKVVERMKSISANEAVAMVLEEIASRRDLQAGVIAIDHKGNFGVAHTTKRFPVAVVTKNMKIVKSEW